MRQPLPGHSTFQPGHTMSNHAPSASGASRMTMRVKLILSQTAFIASLSVLRFAMLIIISILVIALGAWLYFRSDRGQALLDRLGKILET